MASIAGVNLSSPRFLTRAAETPRAQPQGLNYQPWTRSSRMRVQHVSAATASDGISEKVASSIKDAQELCAGDPVSGECVAAWDEVEELSAAASHARDKAKDTDPLETYCKDNPSEEECRTYDD